MDPLQGPRYTVEIDFVLSVGKTANHRWDIDNLVKPVLDSLANIIGWREFRGLPQVDDESIDRLVATKRIARAGEQTGVSIRVMASQ